MPEPRQTDMARQADGVLLRRPQGVGRNRLLDAEPVLAGGAVPRPVQPRVVAEDLQPGPDDEDQQEQVEEVLDADPDRQPGTRCGAGRLDGAGVTDDETLHGRHVAEPLRRRHGDDQDDEPDGEQPEQVEPPAATDAHAGSDALHLGDRPRPRRRIDDVLTLGQLRPEAPHRRPARLPTAPARGRLLSGPLAVVQPPDIALRMSPARLTLRSGRRVAPDIFRGFRTPKGNDTRRSERTRPGSRRRGSGTSFTASSAATRRSRSRCRPEAQRCSVGRRWSFRRWSRPRRHSKIMMLGDFRAGYLIADW